MTSLAVTATFVLPDDAVLVPMEELDEQARTGITFAPGDHAFSRPLSRVPTSVVSASTAGLLEVFRRPTTLVDAVIAYATRRSLDPEQTLEESFGMLMEFVNSGLLLPADSELAQPIAASLDGGAQIGGYTVVGCAHVLVDTEVYLARTTAGDWAALKVARSGAERRMAATFAHEAAVLALLAGVGAPHLLGLVEDGAHRGLALSWCAGVPLQSAAQTAGELGRDAVLELCDGVLAAYAGLHERGFVHGDVHPGNVLVEGDRDIVLVDFGLTRCLDPSLGLADPGRGGVDLFLEPEHAQAILGGRPRPPCTTAGEQYAVAALLYLAITGAHTHDFSLEEEPMLRQIVAGQPRPMQARGADALDAVEAVLFRALDLDPARRFASLREMQSAFAAVRASSPGRPALANGLGAATTSLVEAVLTKAAPGGGLRFEAPTASLQNGAAGLAYMLLRAAGIRGDEHLLALADTWSTRAVALLGNDEALSSEALEITADKVGHRSILHGAGGVHLVAGLVASARGDLTAGDEAVAGFLTTMDPDDAQHDVAFGRAGALLACAALLEAAGPGHRTELEQAGEDVAAGLWSDLAGLDPIGVEDTVGYTGAAHGWAGVLLALLRWAQESGTDPPTGVRDRLDELAALATPYGRGLAWPRTHDSPAVDDLVASWCNGAAGHVALWAEAARYFDDDRFARLAAAAAWTAYEHQPAMDDLCCGWAGRAYALTELYRYGGDEAWLQRARLLCERAARGIRETSPRPDSLLKGAIGVALLSIELECPEEAGMPLLTWR